MKISILSDDKIITLATNPNEVLKSILSNSTNAWLYEWFGENAFTQSKLDVDTFVLQVQEDNLLASDFSNAVTLFEKLNLTESQAYDERLWYGLTFDLFYDYMTKRYSLLENIDYLRSKWLMTNDKKSNLYTQGISSLWWKVYLTYDEDREDKYEFTQFLFQHESLLSTITAKDFCNSSEVRLAMIESLRDYQNNFGDVEDKFILNGIVKYGTFLGSTCIIDIFTREELYEKFYASLVDLHKEKEKQAVTL